MQVLSARSRDIVRAVLPYFAVFAFVMTMTAIHVARFEPLSPIDELRHLDYVERASNFDFPKLGDKLHQPAMREEACRGAYVTGYESPPCKSKQFKPKDFRDDGYQNATFHPPPYYLVTGLLSRGLVEVGISNNLVDPARVFSGFLVAIGLCLTVWAGVRLGLRPWPLAGASVAIVASLFRTFPFINPDSASILVGAGILLLAIAWERGRIPMWALAVAGGVATGVKLTNAVAVGIVAMWFLIRAVPVDWPARVRARVGFGTDPDPPIAVDDADGAGTPLGARRYLTAALVLVGGALAIAMLWAVIDGLRATIDASQIPQNREFAADGFPPLGLLLAPENLFAFLPPFLAPIPLEYLTDTSLRDLGYLNVILFTGALATVGMGFRRDDRITILAAVTFVLLLVGAPLFSLLQVVFNDIWNNTAGRYGLSAVPVLVIVLASAARGRLAGAVLTAFGAVAGLLMLVAVLP